MSMTTIGKGAGFGYPQQPSTNLLKEGRGRSAATVVKGTTPVQTFYSVAPRFACFSVGARSMRMGRMLLAFTTLLVLRNSSRGLLKGAFNREDSSSGLYSPLRDWPLRHVNSIFLSSLSIAHLGFGRVHRLQSACKPVYLGVSSSWSRPAPYFAHLT